MNRRLVFAADLFFEHVVHKEYGLMSNTHEYEASKVDYRVDLRSTRPAKTAQHRRSNSTRRRNNAPKSFNGIHRRRRKKSSW